MSSVPVSHQWDKAAWNWPLEAHDGIVKVHNDATEFYVTLDVPHFTPDEVKVSVVGDEVIINCQHQERKDSHGRVTRSLTRAYHLPSDVDPSSLKSVLSPRGHLHIQAAKKK